MKREDVKALFPDATEEQVTAFLNKVGEELNPLKRDLKDAQGARDTAQAALADAQQQGATLQEQLDAANAQLDAHMTDEERIAAREKAAADREREFALKSNALDAREVFVQSGFFAADDIDALVEQVTGEDADATKSRAERIVATVKSQREAVEKATKDALLKQNPKLGGNGGDGAPTTMKEFLALPLSEQVAMKQANPNILKELT